jgi:hypothetical protein
MSYTSLVVRGSPYKPLDYSSSKGSPYKPLDYSSSKGSPYKPLDYSSSKGSPYKPLDYSSQSGLGDARRASSRRDPRPRSSLLLSSIYRFELYIHL